MMVPGGKGPHSVNGDYAYQVWAYNANDFLAVEDGQMQPWEVQPYATWNLDFPQVQRADILGEWPSIHHRTDCMSGEWSRYSGTNTYLPVVQVYQLTLSPPPAWNQ